MKTQISLVLVAWWSQVVKDSDQHDCALHLLRPQWTSYTSECMLADLSCGRKPCAVGADCCWLRLQTLKVFFQFCFRLGDSKLGQDGNTH